MSRSENAVESTVDKIVLAMEKPAFRMISSVIMCGYLCSGEKKPTTPGNNLALEFLQNPPEDLNNYISKAIMANAIIWSADPIAREEIFAGEDSLDDLLPIISNGGMQWLKLVRDELITKEDFSTLFEYLKTGFTACAGENGKSHEKYKKILEALDFVIAANNGEVKDEEENHVEMLGELLGAAASYAIVNIYGGETLIPIMGSYLDDGTIKFDRILGADFDKERMFEKGYTGDLNSAIEHGSNLMGSNINNAAYNVLIFEKEDNAESRGFDFLHCVGVKYSDPSAQVDILFPYQKKANGKEFEMFMPNPVNLEPQNLNVDTVMNKFLSGLKRDAEGWKILQGHFNNEPHPAMQ